MPESTTSSPQPDLRADSSDVLARILRKRILLLDGAMGTLIQGFQPGEKEFRGERFAAFRAFVCFQLKARQRGHLEEIAEEISADGFFDQRDLEVLIGHRIE